MKDRLLIIDDRMSNRKGTYKSVLSGHFELKIVEKASQLENIIESTEVDGYLVDIVLSNWKNKYNEPLQVIEVLKKIKSVFANGEEKPIFLVSNEYENLIKGDKLTSLINQTIDEEININTFFTFGEFLGLGGSSDTDNLRPIPNTIIWHIKKNIAKIEKEKNKAVDYAIITALYYNEMEEVLKAFSIGPDSRETFGNYFGYKFEYNNKRIIFLWQQDMGMVDSALLSSEVMLKYNPKYIFMPGVCAGSDKTQYGDIILAKKILLFQTGKLTDETLELESTVVDIDSYSVQAILSVGKEILKEIQDEFSSEVQERLLQEFEIEFNEFPEKRKKTNMILSHFKNRKDLKPLNDVTACSTFVVDRKDYFDEIRKTKDRKLIGLEMEGYGIARASQIIKNRTKTVMIKSVMDKADEKSDFFKGFAAYVSAQFVKKLIDKNVLG